MAIIKFLLFPRKLWRNVKQEFRKSISSALNIKFSDILGAINYKLGYFRSEIYLSALNNKFSDGRKAHIFIIIKIINFKF